MLISGVYFTLFKFERPKDFEPLLQAPSTSNKKRKLGAGESSTGQPKCQAAKEVSNAQLASLIPLGYIKVVYHSAPVFDDIRTLDLRLSDAFRQTLRERLADVDFQPCSLFDLRSAQYVPIEKDLVRSNKPHVVYCSRVPLGLSQGIDFPVVFKYKGGK